jgi:hypothetical protein
MLKGLFVGLSIRRSAAIVEVIEAAVFVTVIDLVACDSGNTEITAQRCHPLASEEPDYETKFLIHRVTLFPRHLGSPQLLICVNDVSGTICKLCVE